MKKFLILFFLINLCAMEKQKVSFPFKKLPLDLQQYIIQNYGFQSNALAQELYARRLVNKNFYSWLNSKEQLRGLAHVCAQKGNIAYPVLLRSLTLKHANELYKEWKLGAESSQAMGTRERVNTSGLRDFFTQYFAFNVTPRELRYKIVDCLCLTDGSFFIISHFEKLQLLTKYTANEELDAQFLPVVTCWLADEVTRNHCAIVDGKIKIINETIRNIITTVYDLDGMGESINERMPGFRLKRLFDQIN